MSIPQIQPTGERPNVERNIVTPPNQQLQGYNHLGSSHDLSHALDVVHGSNEQISGPISDRVGGSHDLTRSASPVSPPNNRFDINGARMPQPQSPTKWAPGAVPIRGANGKKGQDVSFMKSAKK